MRLLTDEEIKDYILKDQPLFSCGSYKYESLGKNLFKSVIGSADAIQGLPLEPLLKALENH